MVKNDFKTVDEYIQSFPKKTQVHLKSIEQQLDQLHQMQLSRSLIVCLHIK